MSQMIAIIVPVYNSAETLGICLESVCGQTYKDIKIILVENGSTDDSYQKCLEWAGKDERIVVLQSEKGVSAARNKGLEYAESIGVDYFGFVDSDDYIESTMYEELHKCASRTGADMVFCNFYFQTDNVVKEVRISADSAHKLQAGDVSPLICTNKNNVMGSVWRILFKMAIHGLAFEEEIGFKEDLIFTVQGCLCAKRIETLGKALYHYNAPQTGIKKYYGDNIIAERENYLRTMERVLTTNGRDDLIRIVKVNELIEMLGCFVQHDDYIQAIRQLYSREIFKKECREWKSFVLFLKHSTPTFKSKISACLLYFGLYRLYRTLMKLRARKKNG